MRELAATATIRLTKAMSWTQQRVGTDLQRVHTDCFGRKFNPQRSQNTLLSRAGRGIRALWSPQDYRLRIRKYYWSEVQRKGRQCPFWHSAAFFYFWYLQVIPGSFPTLKRTGRASIHRAPPAPLRLYLPLTRTYAPASF